MHTDPNAVAFSLSHAVLMMLPLAIVFGVAMYFATRRRPPK
jgi:hypothetical protein